MNLFVFMVLIISSPICHLTTKKVVPVCLLAILIGITGWAFAGSEKSPVTYKEIPEIQFIRPQKPLSIKLKRQKRGDYTWEISGSNVEEILEVDRQLRKVLNSSSNDNE